MPYGDYSLSRTVIRKLVALDEAAGVRVVLDPGEPIENWQILRRPPDPELGVYVMDFESAGRRLCCPLVHFQARTATVSLS